MHKEMTSFVMLVFFGAQYSCPAPHSPPGPLNLQLIDGPSSIVSLLLRYLYTDTIHHHHHLTTQHLQQLLQPLAHRWLLAHVVDKCQSYITEALLTPAIALPWLLWADEQGGARFSEGVFELAMELLAGDFQNQMKGKESEMAKLFARSALAMEVTRRAVA